MTTSLATARELLAMTEDEAREKLGPDADEGATDYERLDDLVQLRNTEVLEGNVYLQGGKVRLVYVGEAGLAGVTPADIDAKLADEPVILQSRAGKTAYMVVRAKEGVAYSTDGDEVHFIEVFPPCSQDEYESEIYEEPTPFTR